MSKNHITRTGANLISSRRTTNSYIKSERQERGREVLRRAQYLESHKKEDLEQVIDKMLKHQKTDKLSII